MTHDDYCDVCHRASCLAFTSIDDARQGIKSAGVDEIYMAAKFEMGLGRKHVRGTMMKMLRTRLGKLVGLRDPKFPGEDKI